MSLISQLDIDLKEAMVNKDSETLSVLRLLKSALKNTEIDKGRELNDQEILAVFEKQAKQRKDSIDQYTKGNRDDLARKEQSELEVIERYLPQKMGVDELTSLIESVIKETCAESISQMGLVIKEVMSKANGTAEGSEVSRIVKEKLS